MYALDVHHIVVQNGWTPLLDASTNGHTETVELLVSHGAQLDVRNEVLLLDVCMYTYAIFLAVTVCCSHYLPPGGQDSFVRSQLEGPHQHCEDLVRKRSKCGCSGRSKYCVCVGTCIYVCEDRGADV